MKNILLIVLTLLSPIVNSMTIDGQLDEANWQTAQTLNNFTTIEPFTLEKPDHNTEARIFSDASGIYIGIVSAQPSEKNSTERSARDAESEADLINVIIDFDQTALSAYEFTVTNGGSILDGIWSNGNSLSTDWDGIWYAQTSSTDTHWTAEVHIPWEIAPMQAVKGDQRNINLIISRRVAYLNKHYGNAPTNSSRQRFLSELSAVTINNHAGSALDIFGYVSSRQDLLADEAINNAGLDIFWKPDSSKQLSLTLNPDFGQIESDELVVNFSPDETFFGEKRPFFTENQSLFDFQGLNDLRAIHTRRIGSRPDAGNNPSSDLIGALKFTGNAQAFNYGLFSAIEDDTTQSQGRNYYAGRLVRKTDQYGIGYLATYVDRPEIERTATVQASDYEYHFNDKVLLLGQTIYSDVKTSTAEIKDSGNWLSLQHLIRDNWEQELAYFNYGKQLEINDLGFLPRNNIKKVYYEMGYRINDYPAEHTLKEYELESSVAYTTDDSGKHLSSGFFISGQGHRKDTEFLRWEIFANSKGVDDRLTRGNGDVDIKSGHNIMLMYNWGTQSAFRIHAHIIDFDKTIDGNGWKFHLHPSYFFTDRYKLEWSLFFTEGDRWLLWQNANQLAQFDRQLMENSLNFDATFSEKQELRFKFQWVSLRAETQQALQVTPTGQLISSANTVNDFSRSETSLQIRYRYEFGPLSNLFIVYSRGSFYNVDESESLGDLFTPGWDNTNADNFIVKLRYRF